MTVLLGHLRHQLPVIAALGRVALLGALRKKRPAGVPGPELTATLPPRPPTLVHDFLRHVGGDPSAYEGTLPPHLFPQWAFPLAARTLEGAPYPLARVLNAGCRLELRRPLPSGEPLQVRAHLAQVDDDGRRAVLRQRAITGTADAPDALVADLYAVVPLFPKEARSDGRREVPHVPEDAQELACWTLAADAGLTFAALTGDINPVHWLRPWARALGFQSTILHGFATLSRTFEALNRTQFGGRTDRLCTLDVKFTRPLVLPATVRLYLANQHVFVGEAPGAPAYLTGTFTAHPEEP
jgi:hypothetical protein